MKKIMNFWCLTPTSKCRVMPQSTGRSPHYEASMASRQMTLPRQCAAYFWVLLKDFLGGSWGVVHMIFNSKYVRQDFRNLPYLFDPQTLHKTSRNILRHASMSQGYLSNVTGCSWTFHLQYFLNSIY